MIFDVRTVKPLANIRGDHSQDVLCDACFARLQLYHSVPVLHQFSSSLSCLVCFSLLYALFSLFCWCKVTEYIYSSSGLQCTLESYWTLVSNFEIFRELFFTSHLLECCS